MHQKFQDLEEERLDFTKSSLWAYANIASTVCVSDDSSCEKIRLSLENCEVEKDINNFIKTCGTGQEIPDPPKYINFCRGDIDSASEASEDEGYAVAQFQRNTKPEYRSASPSHSASGSDYPQSELTQRMNRGPGMDEEDEEPIPSKTNSGRPAPLNYRQAEPAVPPNYSPSQHGDIAQVPHNEYPTEGMTMYCRTGPPSVTGSGLSSNTRPSSRDDQSEYSAPSSFTSADPRSGKNSPTKSMPAGGVELPGMSSSPDKSIQKKRSGFFSNSPFRRKSKRDPDHQVQTPASNRNTWNPSSNLSGINPTPSIPSSQQSSPDKYARNPRPQSRNLFNRNQPPEGEEPADPRASFQLNVGNNVFDVASPDSHQSTPKASMNNRRAFPGSAHASSIGAPDGDLSMDPIAQALADLKSSSNGNGLGMNKQASMRMQADRHLGVQTPAPDAQSPSRPGVISAQSADRLAAQRGTPPPAYDGGGRGSALGVPQPAFTSSEMRKRTETWGAGSATGSRPGHGNIRSQSPGPGMPRAASPQPQQNMRSRSPGPGAMRARSPGPDVMRARSPGPGAMRARSPAPGMIQQPARQNTGSSYPRIGGDGGRPSPHGRQSSGMSIGMEMQLSSSDVQRYDQGRPGSGRSGSGMMNSNARPNSAYGGNFGQQPQQQQGYDPRARGSGGVDPGLRRERSKSMASVPMGPGGGKREGSGPPGALHYGMLLRFISQTKGHANGVLARALYSYSAAIPEELSFSKGDILAVLRLQDDGWWEAEVTRSFKGGANGGARGVGLVPSNYLVKC